MMERIIRNFKERKKRDRERDNEEREEEKMDGEVRNIERV